MSSTKTEYKSALTGDVEKNVAVVQENERVSHEDVTAEVPEPYAAMEFQVAEAADSSSAEQENGGGWSSAIPYADSDKELEEILDKPTVAMHPAVKSLVTPTKEVKRQPSPSFRVRALLTAGSFAAMLALAFIASFNWLGDTQDSPLADEKSLSTSILDAQVQQPAGKPEASAKTKLSFHKAQQAASAPLSPRKAPDLAEEAEEKLLGEDQPTPEEEEPEEFESPPLQDEENMDSSSIETTEEGSHLIDKEKQPIETREYARDENLYLEKEVVGMTGHNSAETAQPIQKGY